VKTGLITSNTYQNHNTGEGHPEKIDRVTAVIDNFKKIDNKELIWKKPARFDQSFLINTHSSEYIDLVSKSFPKNGLAFLDGDTVVSPGSKEATKDAVGSIITAIDGVQKKEFKNAFCAVRPPGHHAEKDKAMGFCIYNNVAVGANYLIDRYKYSKVAIIDFDVHHGNGTQELLWDEARCLTFTSQQIPLWPGTGAEEEQGKFNNIVNIPLPPGSSGALMRQKYEASVFPALQKFEPELILISAGFDAHEADPLGELNWSTKDFSWLTERLCAVASNCCEGRLVSILEGGYNLDALADSVKAHVIKLCEA